MRSHPAQLGADRFGPTTIKRSGSEHRRAVFLFFPEVSIPRKRGNRRGCKDH